MPIENTTTIDGLNVSWPLESDGVGEGNNHISQNKTVLKTMFPGITGNGLSEPIVATEDELNTLAGLLATTDELNKLDGLQATTGEIDYNAGVTPGTVQVNNTVVTDANNQFTFSTGGINFQPNAAIGDTNGLPVISVGTVAGNVNGVTVTGGSTGNPARIQGTGEASAGIVIEALGSGYVSASGGGAGEAQAVPVILDVPTSVLINNSTGDVDWTPVGLTGYPANVKAFIIKSHLFSFRASNNLTHELFLSPSQTGTRPAGSDTVPSIYSATRNTGTGSIISKGEHIVPASGGDITYAIDRAGTPLTTGVLELVIVGFYV